MAYMVMKSPAVTIDIMVEKKYLPQLVSYIARMGCVYASERESGPVKGREYVILKDISSNSGKGVGELFNLFYSMAWPTKMGDPEDKFYIMLNTRKRERKDVGENRSETSQGCDSGDQRESTINTESGSDC